LIQQSNKKRPNEDNLFDVLEVVADENSGSGGSDKQKESARVEE